MDERIGFGLYQYCVNMMSVGRVSVFGLRWCGCCRWGVGSGLAPRSGGAEWRYVCVRCESAFSVYMACPCPCICILFFADTCAS